jgi:lipopolysaccharide assembly outer membrane protein LptD (OstA)
VRILLLSAIVLGIALAPSAQPSDQSRPQFRVAAANRQAEPGGVRFSQRVQITLADGTVVTADEAFMPSSTLEMELHGNVRLKFPSPSGK